MAAPVSSTTIPDANGNVSEVRVAAAGRRRRFRAHATDLRRRQLPSRVGARATAVADSPRAARGASFHVTAPASATTTAAASTLFVFVIATSGPPCVASAIATARQSLPRPRCSASSRFASARCRA